MIDVFASVPGRSPDRGRAPDSSSPLEKAFWSIPGVEYVYSTSSPGRAMLESCAFAWGRTPTARSFASECKLDAPRGDWPHDLAPPLVKARSIDDVPVWAMTFWRARRIPRRCDRLPPKWKMRSRQSRRSRTRRSSAACAGEFRVELDPARLSARGLSGERGAVGALEAASRCVPSWARSSSGGPRDQRRGWRFREETPRSSAPSPLPRAAAAPSAWATWPESSTGRKSRRRT